VLGYDTFEAAFGSNQSPDAAMRPVRALALHSGSVLAEGTEHEHHHPFLAASRSGGDFTVADFLVRITTVAVLVGALVERGAGGSARHVSGRRHDHIATPAPASMPNMKTTTPTVIFAVRPGHSGSRGGAILLGAEFVTGLVGHILHPGDVSAVHLWNAPHVLAPRFDLVFSQSPAHGIARDAVVFGEPDPRTSQQIEGPPRAALGRA
jgi:hypothetical protein